MFYSNLYAIENYREALIQTNTCTYTYIHINAFPDPSINVKLKEKSLNKGSSAVWVSCREVYFNKDDNIHEIKALKAYRQTSINTCRVSEPNKQGIYLKL